MTTNDTLTPEQPAEDEGPRRTLDGDRVMDMRAHQSQLAPENNKFHAGNGSDGKHYWLTPPAVYDALNAEFRFTFDPCPFPKPEDFDGLTCDWGESNYVNPPFGSIMHQGPGDKKPKKKGPTAWVRKAIAEHEKGKRVVMVYPVDKWVLMLLQAGAQVRNLGDVRWLATEDGSEGKGTGRHIACFILDHPASAPQQPEAQPVAWVAADTLHSPHPACVSSLAYMSQLDRERGREYVPLYAAPKPGEGCK